MRKIILLGGGGHCSSCIEAIESTREWKIVGIVDKPDKVGGTVLGYPVLCDDGGMDRLIAETENAIVTVGQIRSPLLRKALFSRAKAVGFSLPAIVASTSCVSRHARVGKGSIALHHALVNAGAVIGENCIINSGAIIEHDSRVGDHCHVSTGAIVNGACVIGDDVFLGSRAVVAQGISIAPGIVVGAGAVVLNDLDVPGTYVGCPARRIEYDAR